MIQNTSFFTMNVSSKPGYSGNGVIQVVGKDMKSIKQVEAGDDRS
jgi:hypothetical protein